MPRLPDCLSALPLILGSSALLTFGILVLIPMRSGPDEAARGSLRVSARADDPWRLRPGDVVTTSSIAPVEPRGRPAGEIPDERRLVRVVYPGLAGSR